MIEATMIGALASAGPFDIAWWVVIILALVALVVIAARALKVPVPQWVWEVLGVLLIAFVLLMAIRLLAAM